MLPISSTTLTPKTRKVPYYSNVQAYLKFTVSLTKRRMTGESFKNKLFIKQQGLCAHCGCPMEETESLELTNDYVVNKNQDTLEIHHKKPISEGYRSKNKKTHKAYNTLKNMLLMHKQCHYVNTHSGES